MILESDHNYPAHAHTLNSEDNKANDKKINKNEGLNEGVTSNKPKRTYAYVAASITLVMQPIHIDIL